MVTFADSNCADVVLEKWHTKVNSRESERRAGNMDKISQMLSSIKNAAMARKAELSVDYSQECENIAKILKERKFLEEVKTFKPKDSNFKKLNLVLSYEDGLPRITDVKRVSKPGQRIYRGYDKIYRVQSGYGVAVVSTSRGILSGEEAKKKKLGGEVICHVF
jgi:small subunit ribosomal protein S8